MTKNIESILNPKSIAVVGASKRPGSVGFATFSNLIKGDYQGVIYPVNPKVRSICGVRAYPSLMDIPDEVDLAVLIVPPPAVLEVVEEAGRKGVKGLLVITAGFKEIGGQGAALETRLGELARGLGIPLVGPNCLGVINTSPDIKMNASFAAKMPKKGNIGFISQSGALCTAVLDVAQGRNIGFSKFISFGNKADVNEIDLLNYLKDDPQTDVILMYLEEISDGGKFIETAREIAWQVRKPMLAIKSGVSPEGAKAASSHTGSLAGSDTAYDAIFLQSGIQRVEGVNELFHYAIGFSTQPLPKGNRIAIVTNAGGPGIMATDAAVRHGLKLASFTEATKMKLRKNLPPTASVHNPVDVIGDATHERYEAALNDVLADENVDGAVVILTPQAMTDIVETAQIVPRAAERTDKPILCSFMGTVDVSAGVDYLQEHGLPNYVFPESAMRTMASMVKFASTSYRAKRQTPQIMADCRTAAGFIRRRLNNKKTDYLGEHDCRELLSCYGFPLLKARLIPSPDEIESAGLETGFPVVMKICSPDIIHKSDAGGVKVNIKDAEQARRAYGEILGGAEKYRPGARIDGVLMVEMARPGVEVIIGGMRDPKFGPICMFGLGGVFVELFKDVSFRLAPMWEVSAENMIRSIKGFNLLKGYRGSPPTDLEEIKNCILRLAQMMVENPEISELDINPLIVYPEGLGCVVADSRIALAEV
ncbi:MAG: acetate--CoA ligase [Pseudomonadota bacterium]